jgi:hypothetical protein
MEDFLAYGLWLMVLATIVLTFVVVKAIRITLDKAIALRQQHNIESKRKKADIDAAARKKQSMEDSAMADIEAAAKEYPDDVGALLNSYKSIEKQAWFSHEFMRGYLAGVSDLALHKKTNPNETNEK